ncbi:MAG: VWA domain-containing protein [Lewinellaceae bacterium]|nr:VWA domain-containing protein [Lewinellaceae bacterium]
MLRFEYIEHLYALLVAPVLLLFFGLAWRARKRAIRRFGESALMARLMPKVSRYRYFIKFGLLLLALVLLAIAWANPQYGARLAKVKAKSVDIIIAFDVSQSMLAEDIPPSRLARARRFTQSLVESLQGERLGLILFAGSAFVQSPVTVDFSAILQSIRSANPSMIPNQGTAIAEAIELAAESFDKNNKNHKALVIITDGEDHEEDAIAQAKAARANGLLIFTVGVGTEKGSFIPVDENGRQDYKRDQSGQPVVSHLNESILREVARAGDGSYFNLSAGSAQVVEALQEGIGRMEKRELEQRVFSEYNSYFQWFVGLALLLLFLEFLLPYRSSQRLTGKDLFDV